MKNVLIKTNIPQILKGELPQYSGMILHGPGGTGKTELANAIMEVYESLGRFDEALEDATKACDLGLDEACEITAAN